MNRLPQDFLNRMQKILGEDFSLFLKTYDEGRYYGLRANTLKITPEELKKKVSFHLTPIPWVKEGFYYEEEDDPGKHYYHNAGLYYIQEPTAMAPAMVLDAKPGEKILDLCAAPGGKTTQIAANLKGQGLVVANDISLKRAQVLAMNVERMGIKNAFITNEMPRKLAEYFPQYFDRILVDAPCSGEGMFRKMPEVIEHWSNDYIKKCSEMQKSILEFAAIMLKPGGILVYSTCTFSPEENEGTVQNFLDNHPEFELMEIPHKDGFKPGEPHWIESGQADLKKTVRLWPHQLKGEGHFIAKFKKTAGENVVINPYRDLPLKKDLLPYLKFCQDNLKILPEGIFTLFGNHLYLTPEELPDFKGLKIVRPGWYLGEFKKNRFEPSHSLAMALKPGEAYQTATLSDFADIASYLRGETLRVNNSKKGWILVETDGFSLGWGKGVDGLLKNHYPKTYRWLF